MGRREAGKWGGREVGNGEGDGQSGERAVGWGGRREGGRREGGRRASKWEGRVSGEGGGQEGLMGREGKWGGLVGREGLMGREARAEGWRDRECVGERERVWERECEGGRAECVG